jgi:hypothetical protein
LQTIESSTNTNIQDELIGLLGGLNIKTVPPTTPTTTTSTKKTKSIQSEGLWIGRRA